MSYQTFFFFPNILLWFVCKCSTSMEVIIPNKLPLKTAVRLRGTDRSSAADTKGSPLLSPLLTCSSALSCTVSCTLSNTRKNQELCFLQQTHLKKQDILHFCLVAALRTQLLHDLPTLESSRNCTPHQIVSKPLIRTPARDCSCSVVTSIKARPQHKLCWPQTYGADSICLLQGPSSGPFSRLPSQWRKGLASAEARTTFWISRSHASQSHSCPFARGIYTAPQYYFILCYCNVLTYTPTLRPSHGLFYSTLAHLTVVQYVPSSVPYWFAAGGPQTPAPVHGLPKGCHSSLVRSWWVYSTW